MSHGKEQILVGQYQEDVLSDTRGEEELFLSLPYSDFSGWVYTNDAFFDTYRSINTRRLRGVHSLSNLSPIIPGIDIDRQHLMIHNHTRDYHTFVVAALGAQILANNDLSQNEIKKYLAAAFLHDIATPAYGDSTKFVDLENLHEELFWKEMLDDESKKYLKDINVSNIEIDQIIKNKGVLGEILDIADRITYVMQDASQTPFWNDYVQPTDLDIKYLRTKKNTIGDLYKDIKIDKTTNEVYFTNPSALYDFLLLRVLLHKYVYLSPINQGRDMIVAKTIEPFYSSDISKSNLLTPPILRGMTDHELVEDLAIRKSVNSMELSRYLETWQPQHYEKFLTRDAADKRARELYEEDKQIFGIKECNGFKPSTKYNVLNAQGNIVSFKDFDPQKSQYLQEIADSTKGVYIFYND